MGSTSVMLWADSYIASMMLGLLFVFFVSFLVFMFISFSRIIVEMGKWITTLRMWTKVCNCMKSDWMRSFMVACTFPFLMCFLFLSFINQCVRKCRGLTRHVTT